MTIMPLHTPHRTSAGNIRNPLAEFLRDITPEKLVKLIKVKVPRWQCFLVAIMVMLVNRKLAYHSCINDMPLHGAKPSPPLQDIDNKNWGFA